MNKRVWNYLSALCFFLGIGLAGGLEMGAPLKNGIYSIILMLLAVVFAFKGGSLNV